jgi:hypothetical protein
VKMLDRCLPVLSAGIRSNVAPVWPRCSRAWLTASRTCRANALRLARLLTLGTPSGATTDQDHRDDDGCYHAWSEVDQEDAEQTWSAQSLR